MLLATVAAAALTITSAPANAQQGAHHGMTVPGTGRAELAAMPATCRAAPRRHSDEAGRSLQPDLGSLTWPAGTATRRPRPISTRATA